MLEGGVFPPFLNVALYHRSCYPYEGLTIVEDLIKCVIVH